ncbi:hypothetical protein [Nocardioides sp.]|uniref:hypothetical protein n=1 Tax=Nocardioides sp. TaxID=35761 RepID=UPI002B2788B9|nr:hypothetical protein [Nocardioides sp.]
MNPSPTAAAVRRLATVSVALAATGATTLMFAGPASAEPAEGWPATEPVDGLNALLLLGGIPLLLFVVIAVLTYLPAMVRGESIAPGSQGVEDQWLGGPRTSGELAAPDGETSAAGGASGRW